MFDRDTPTINRLALGSLGIALPVVLLWLSPYQLSPLPGWVDVGMYLGYSFDFQGLVDRYGFTYHGMRWTLTLPAHLLDAVFQPSVAHMLLLVLHMALAGLSTYQIIRTSQSVVASLLGMCFIILNPI